MTQISRKLAMTKNAIKVSKDYGIICSEFMYERGLIYNGNTFITPHINAPELLYLIRKERARIHLSNGA